MNRFNSTTHNNTLCFSGKTASLGEMIQNLTPLGVSVPGGFGVSSTAYDAVLDRFELRERLDLLLKDVDVNNLDDLAGKCVVCMCSSWSSINFV